MASNTHRTNLSHVDLHVDLIISTSCIIGKVGSLLYNVCIHSKVWESLEQQSNDQFFPRVRDTHSRLQKLQYAPGVGGIKVQWIVLGQMYIYEQSVHLKREKRKAWFGKKASDHLTNLALIYPGEISYFGDGAKQPSVFTSFAWDYL